MYFFCGCDVCVCGCVFVCVRFPFSYYPLLVARTSTFVSTAHLLGVLFPLIESRQIDCLQHATRIRILDQCQMTEDILIGHLYGVGALRTYLLDGATYIRRAHILQTRYANVQRDECACLRVID